LTRRKIRLALDAPGGAEELIVATASDGRTFTVEWRGSTSTAEVASLPDGRLSVVFDDGRQLCARTKPSEGAVSVSAARGSLRVPIADPRRHRAGSQDAGVETGREEVRALMPGRVLEVSVEEGDVIEAGVVLLVLEAMKMQNEIRASRAGRVARVAVAAGQSVDGGALMIVLEEGPS